MRNLDEAVGGGDWVVVEELLVGGEAGEAEDLMAVDIREAKSMMEDFVMEFLADFSCMKDLVIGAGMFESWSEEGSIFKGLFLH